MGVRLPSVFTNTFIGPLPANANETIIFQLPPISPQIDNAPILFFWCLDVTGGTTATGHVVRIRRGTALTGALVMVLNMVTTEVAGARNVASGVYFDTPGVVAGQQYVLTLSQTAATGAGTFNDGAFMAACL